MLLWHIISTRTLLHISTRQICNYASLTMFKYNWPQAEMFDDLCARQRFNVFLCISVRQNTVDELQETEAGVDLKIMTQVNVNIFCLHLYSTFSQWLRNRLKIFHYLYWISHWQYKRNLILHYSDLSWMNSSSMGLTYGLFWHCTPVEISYWVLRSHGRRERLKRRESAQ